MNPNYLQRIPQHRNEVDARLIDNETNYYLEITGVSTRIDLGEETKLTNKFGTTFKHSQIFPIRRVLFENMLVWIPSKPEEYLSNEFTNESLNSASQNVSI